MPNKHIYLSDPELAFVEREMERTGDSRSGVIRKAIEQYQNEVE